MPNTKKKNILKAKIEECAKDPCKLHSLVNNLTTKNVDVELPDHVSDDQLAEDFASYFQGKIDKICNSLMDKPKFTTPESDMPKLMRFTPLAEGQVSKIVNSLKSNSCELDAIPTTILKKMLPKVIPLITKIVNILLGEGCFCREWKTAVVRPLLKRLGLQLVFTNYRPVSNLTFVSKIVEQCMLL